MRPTRQEPATGHARRVDKAPAKQQKVVDEGASSPYAMPPKRARQGLCFRNRQKNPAREAKKKSILVFVFARARGGSRKDAP